MSRSNIFLGFDFYGAGNIGDDLMISGFLDAFRKSEEEKLSCALPAERIKSQMNRFPRMDWQCWSEVERKKKIDQFDIWLGVGGTPFQASSGPWLLNRILSDFECSEGNRKFMLGVGCEKEVVREIEAARQVVHDTEMVWTRDDASREVLVSELGADPDRVRTGGDLANIALDGIFTADQAANTVSDSVGIVYFTSRNDRSNLSAMRSFAQEISSQKETVFLANDVRESSGFETDTYRRSFGGWRRLSKQKPRFFQPDYKSRNVHELVAHFRQFDTVIAGRYHALLTAAWAGCKVAAIEHSSKLRFLAEELGIPLVRVPFSADSLHQGYLEARRVPRELLQAKRDAARKSVMEFWQMLHDTKPH